MIEGSFSNSASSFCALAILILELIVGRRELGDFGRIGADCDEIFLDPALHRGDAIVLQPNDLLARVGVAVTGERFLELLFVVELVAEINRERVQLDDVVGQGDLLVDRLERAERFGAVAFLSVKLGQHRRAAHRIGRPNFFAGQFFQRANRFVVLARCFEGFGFEKERLLAQLRIVFQRGHLRGGVLEILAQQIRLRDRKRDAAGVRAFGKFRLVVFEGGDRLRVIAGVEISGADRVKNRLDLRRHFDARDERFQVGRGLGEIAGLKFHHRLAVGGGEIGLAPRRRLLGVGVQSERDE